MEATRDKPIRVLVGKPGLDGHNRGVRVIVKALRDAGMEVIYTGIRQTPEQIARAASDEDVEAVGLSSLSGGHTTLFPQVAEALRQRGLGQVLLFCGGIIPQEDEPALRQAGFQGVFGPGTEISEVIDFLKRGLRP